jgi:hypothetical protein
MNHYVISVTIIWLGSEYDSLCFKWKREREITLLIKCSKISFGSWIDSFSFEMEMGSRVVRTTCFHLMKV